MMLERYDVIISEGAPDPMLPEVEGEWVKYADAHATIADLLKYRASLPAQSAQSHEAVKEEVFTKWDGALRKMADGAQPAQGEVVDSIKDRELDHGRDDWKA